MSICAVKGACRSLRSGLPYWPRLKLYMNASYVPLENVQEKCSPLRQAVGSPSFSGGFHAARIGWMAKGVMPKNSAPMHANIRRHRISVRGRRTSTATAAAGAASMPPMWFA